MEMIRIKDIAGKAGVSPTTVSNVIHGNTKKVSKATIEKVEKLLKEVSYVPSMGAKMLAENRSRIIGVLVGGRQDKRRSAQGDAFVNILVSALEDEIFSRNYYMLLHMANSLKECLELAATWNVEGLITIGMSSQDNLKIQSRCRAPIVSIDNYYEKEAVANVGLDDFQGGFVMGRFLAGQGHNKILFLSDNDIGVDHYRFLGFKRALKEALLPCSSRNQIVFPEDGEERMLFYEERMPVFLQNDALFFASDYYALEAINYLRDKGVRIPEDISIAGFDDSEYARLCRPLLTTVFQDVGQKGVVAVDKLFAFIEGKKNISMNEYLPVKLIIRNSVKNNV